MEPTTKNLLNVLIVEDESAIAELISLSLEGLPLKIEKVTSAEQAQFLSQNVKYDLYLVDWMLPGEQGVAFIRSLKARDPLALAMLITAKADADSIVQGLESGADDYLVKPFDRRVLVARVQNLIRRKIYFQQLQEQQSRDLQQQKAKDEIYTLDGLSIDLSRVQVILNGQNVHLTPSEFKLLGYLMSSQGRVMTRDQLIDLIQGEDVTVTGRTIDTHVFALRKKLGSWADHIETIRGVGYRVNY